jgi:hypothetical protein
VLCMDVVLDKGSRERNADWMLYIWILRNSSYLLNWVSVNHLGRRIANESGEEGGTRTTQ